MLKEKIKIQDKAIVLADKSAKSICARNKKEIILPQGSGKHIGEPIFLCGDKVYGIIILNEPTSITVDQFKNRYKRHFITEKTRETLWPNIEHFYAYSFRIKRIFKEPINCEIKDIGLIDTERRKEFIKGVIGFRDLGKAPIETSWDGPEERRKASIEDLRIISTWFDNQKPDVKSSYKLPHHKANGQHSAVFRGVAAAMAALLGARGGVDIPSGDRRGIYNHLVKHYKQFDKEAPAFKNYSDKELEKMFPEYFTEDDLTEEIDFKRYYDTLNALEKNYVAKQGYEALYYTLLTLYKLFLNKRELRKPDHTGGTIGGGRRRRRPCPTGMVRDRRTGRCVRRSIKTLCTEEDRKAERCGVGQIYRHSKYDIYDDVGFAKQIKVVVEGNFVRARLRSPSTIVEGTFRTITLSERQGIKAIIGKLKSDPDGATHVQSVIFEKDKWTVASAREWVESHMESLKSQEYIKCQHCETYFDYAAQAEVTMGLVNCPNCDTTVNQKGK